MTEDNDKIEEKADDKIQAEARIMAVLRTAYPVAYTTKAIQRPCQVYWSRMMEVIDKFLEEGIIEKIETSNDPVYRLVKK